MKLSEQRNELVKANEKAQDDLKTLMVFLQSSKFQGQGEDWIRTGEVGTILREIQNSLVNVIEDTGNDDRLDNLPDVSFL